MLAIVGTVPDPSLPVVEGSAVLDGDALTTAGRRIPADRGTPALLAAACAASATLDLPAPHAFLVGDQGQGHGSRALFAHLTDTLPDRHIATLVFHYLMPDVMWHDKVLFAVEAMAVRPRLIADAGFMYAAKMSGQAPAYDLFTPDAGELAFLADESAPHPFYTRGFILHGDNDVPDLIRRAYRGGNAARCLLVKGSVDRVADQGGVLHTVDSPCEEAMEAMGGTGDTVAGIAAALVQAGHAVAPAAHLAARANRLAGQLARPNPGSRIIEIIAHIPQALRQAMNGVGQ
ncbi:sugar kinase [Pseudodesulfovibrio sp. F-1]|uniref:Sugar kinase n=1 Tax=Pseudodesulfovibrio alkaliphilus TaxID=2661613 RepID=A0A7K1KMQ2_9BACT|nr:NAD(P)H-hydrate dehydratase [Pseudodesulfovibrio alkaliphilus]MUM77363.1 sugar kinase [Pseudodesulfovibrio alkaliphilus]